MNADLEDSLEMVCESFLWPEDQYIEEDLSYDDFLFAGANLYGGI